MRGQRLGGFPGEVQRRGAGLAEGLQEVAGEQFDIAGALAQRRQFDAQHAQPVVQVGAETAGGHQVAQRSVAGADHAHVHAARLRGAHAPHFAALQHAQQALLKRRAGGGQLVQEERAAIGGFEESRAFPGGAGKGAARVSEELGFQQRVGEAGAVDAEERARRGAS